MNAAQSKRPDLGDWVSHYRSLFWRWKWFIAVAAPLVSIAAVGVSLRIVSLRPELTATVMIGLEAPSRSDDGSGQANSRIEILRSRQFLQGIVRDLTLRLQTTSAPRASIADTCVVTTDAREGDYIVRFSKEEPGRFTVLLTDRSARLWRSEVGSGTVSAGGTFTLSGIGLRWSDAFARRPYGFAFSVMSERSAVDRLLDKMNITMPNPQQDRDYLSITLNGSDYDLTAKILNTIADDFVQKTFDMRGRRNRETLLALEKQLDEANGQRQQSEFAVRGYLSANPSVALSMSVPQSLTRLQSSQTDSATAEQRRSEVQRLQSAFAFSKDDARREAAQEILAFLSANGETRATVLLADLNRLMNEKSTALAGFSEDHPLVEKNRASLNAIIAQAATALRAYGDKVDQTMTSTQNTIHMLSSQLNSLPTRERQLAELQARQQINAQLHAETQAKYNQARMAEVSAVPDAYIMDYSVAPLPPEQWMLLLGLVAAAVLAGLLCGFGLPAAVDYLDPTARTEFELRRRTSFALAEAVPDLKKMRKTGKKQIRNSGPEIIAHADGWGAEVFRSLRTKMLLSLDGVAHKTIAVASLVPSEGKSLIASHLAVAMARQGLRTVLIDADMRRGTIHEMFGLQAAPGLSELLTEPSIALIDAVKQSLHVTVLPNLSVITSGAMSESPIEAMGSPRMKALHEALCGMFDIIIIDTPPLTIGTDAVVIHEMVSRYLPVALAGKTSIASLERAINRYAVVRSKVVGIVLNKAAVDARSDYQRYLRYYKR